MPAGWKSRAFTSRPTLTRFAFARSSGVTPSDSMTPSSGSGGNPDSGAAIGPVVLVFFFAMKSAFSNLHEVSTRHFQVSQTQWE